MATETLVGFARLGGTTLLPLATSSSIAPIRYMPGHTIGREEEHVSPRGLKININPGRLFINEAL